MLEEVVQDFDSGGVAEGFGPEGLFEGCGFEKFSF